MEKNNSEFENVVKHLNILLSPSSPTLNYNDVKREMLYTLACDDKSV